MAIVEQEENAKAKKKRRSRGGVHKNIEEDKEEGPRQLKERVHADNEELGEVEDVANKEKGSRQRRSRRLIGEGIVNRWKVGEDLETGEEIQDGGEETSSQASKLR